MNSWGEEMLPAWTCLEVHFCSPGIAAQWSSPSTKWMFTATGSGKVRGDRTHVIHNILARDPTSWPLECGTILHCQEPSGLGEASRPGEGAGGDIGLWNLQISTLPKRDAVLIPLLAAKCTSRGRAGCNPQNCVKYNAKVCPEMLMVLYKLWE